MLRIDSLVFGRNRSLLTMPLNATFEFGTFTYIMGPNGIGKTTLLDTLSKLIRPLSGNIQSPPSSRLFTGDILNQFLSVEDFVSLGTFQKSGYLRGQLTNEKIDFYLEKFQLAQIRKKHLYQISDGQKQRSKLAQVFARDFPVIILDEPLSYLDPPGQISVLELLREAAREKKKIVIATGHDWMLAKKYIDQVIFLREEEEAFCGPPKDFSLKKYWGIDP